MAAATSDLIVVAVQRVQAEVPALANLKLVVLPRADLRRAHRARRVGGASGSRCPGPKVTEGEAEDARITLAIPKTMFKLLAEEGGLADWREAFHYGHLKVGGDPGSSACSARRSSARA